MSPSKRPALLALPVEIQLIIISHLNAPERQLLRSTSRHFYTLIPPTTVAERNEIEGSAYNRRLFSQCRTCRILHLISNYRIVSGDDWSYFMCKTCSQRCYLEFMFWNKGPGLEEVDRQREVLRELRRKQDLDEGRWDVVYPHYRTLHETMAPI